MDCYSLKTIQRSFECFSQLLFDLLRLLIVSLFVRFVIVFCYLFSFLSALPQLFRFVLPTYVYIDDDLCRSRISGLLPNALSPRLAVNCEGCSEKQLQYANYLDNFPILSNQNKSPVIKLDIRGCFGFIELFHLRFF